MKVDGWLWWEASKGANWLMRSELLEAKPEQVRLSRMRWWTQSASEQLKRRQTVPWVMKFIEWEGGGQAWESADEKARKSFVDCALKRGRLSLTWSCGSRWRKIVKSQSGQWLKRKLDRLRVGVWDMQCWHGRRVEVGHGTQRDTTVCYWDNGEPLKATVSKRWGRKCDKSLDVQRHSKPHSEAYRR